MNERKMSCIDEIFDRAKSIGVEPIRSSIEDAEIRIIRFGKWRDVMRGVPKRDPYKAIPLFAPMRERARLQRRRRIRLRRDEDALGFTIVAPALKRADNVALHNPALRKLRSAMNAEVLPDTDFAFVTPDDEILTEQTGGGEFAFDNFLRKSDDVPIVDE